MTDPRFLVIPDVARSDDRPLALVLEVDADLAKRLHAAVIAEAEAWAAARATSCLDAR